MIGKVPPDRLAAHVFGRTGADDDAVELGPAYGEDAAVIRIGDRALVVSSDPISLAAERVGTLGVHVACNDVAASGADPRWLTVVLFLPTDREGVLETVVGQIDEAARATGVAVVGGHSEYAPELSRPTLSLTCLGVADRAIPTAGARPGDRVVLAGGAGIEGTAILATDFRERLAGTVPEATLDRAAGFFADISVIDAAAVLRDDATAMHDPTEGGVVDGLLELAHAAGVVLEVDRSTIPVRDETARLTAAVGVDPLRIFGSGGLLATVPADAVDGVISALEAADIDAAVIGTVGEAAESALVLDGETITEPARDDLYALWE